MERDAQKKNKVVVSGFNPIWKICASQIGIISPGSGVKIYFLKPPPRCRESLQKVITNSWSETVLMVPLQFWCHSNTNTKAPEFAKFFDQGRKGIMIKSYSEESYSQDRIGTQKVIFIWSGRTWTIWAWTSQRISLRISKKGQQSHEFVTEWLTISMEHHGC